MQSILKNTVFLFLLFSTVSSWSQTVNFLNLKVAHSDTAYVDVDGDLSDDLAFINNTIIDAAFMLVVGTQDTIWFSEATEDSITFNYSSLANQSTLAGTTLLCSNWNAQGGSMNTLKYMQFYKKLTATDSVFGYIEYMPFEGPMPSQCSDDTLIIYKTVLSDFINSPIYPGQTCNYSLSSTGAECFGNCQGDISVSIISGVAPYSYSWSTGETTSFIDSLCMGTYTVTITDTLGCVWVDSVFIDTSTFTNNFSISGNFNLGPCDLDAEALPVGNAPFTFDWSTGSTNNTIIDLCDGWYNVTISDVYGCELEDSVFIDNNSLTSSLHPNYYQPAGGACGSSFAMVNLPF